MCRPSRHMSICCNGEISTHITRTTMVYNIIAYSEACKAITLFYRRFHRKIYGLRREQLIRSSVVDMFRLKTLVK